MNIAVKIIDVKEVTPPTGQKFKAYKTVDKNGKKMDVKFTRECRNVPTEPCEIIVDDRQANVDTNRQYPCLWVKDVVEIKPLPRKSNMADFFDIEDDPSDSCEGVTF